MKKGKKEYGKLLSGKNRLYGLIVLFILSIVVNFIFLIRYKRINKKELLLVNLIRDRMVTGSGADFKIYPSNRLMYILNEIYTNLPVGVPTADIDDVALGKTFIINIAGKMKLAKGVLERVVVRTNIKHFKYLKTSVKSCGYTGGFTNNNGVWDGKKRFVDNKDGTVYDRLTGLFWLKDFNLNGKHTWYEGVRMAKKCRVGGYTDWRLPQIREIETLIDFNRYNPALPEGHPFINIRRGYYWTGTEYSGGDDYAWFIIMINGALYSYDKEEKFYLIFCREK